MKKSLLIGIMISILSYVNISAQINIDSLPKDPLLDAIWGEKYSPPIKNNNLSFLLQEDSCYVFRIYHIISLPSGYLIQAHTMVDSFNVWAYIVTPKTHPSSNLIQKKIKKGGSYKLHLRKYFLLPAWVGIESGRTVDVMLGNKTLSINENGYYSYLFSSLDLEGLYQIKSQEVAFRERKFQKEEINLKNSISPFLEYISYGKPTDNLFNTVDTLQIKRSLNRYGQYWWGRNPSDFGHTKKRFKWSLDYPVKKHDWLERDGVNSNEYEAVFWKMLKKDYCLPTDTQNLDRNFLYSSIKLKLLHYSEQFIYTVQVIWKLANVNKTYIAILDIQKEGNDYKIVGLNKAYGGYRLYMKEGNSLFVPE